MSDAVATSQQGLAGKYPPYPEYKDSGLEWLGEIPAHWNISRIKYVAQLNPSKSEVRGLSDDTIVSFIPMEAIGERGEIDVSRTRLLGDVLTGYSYITDGDVILAKITPCFENGKGAVVHGLENGIGFATTEVIPARPYRKCDAQFLYYLFTSNPFKALAEGSMYGAGGQKRVADSFVAEYHFAEAPTDERENIAAFLDYETARIDRLIAQQQRLIELLKEKRQAVISHAVTKGLNPNAPMKDSGIEWLGQVPEHWSVVKLSYVLSLKSGDGITSNEIEPEGTYPVYGGNGLRGYCEQFNCNGTYALIGRQGALCGNVNVADGKFFASEHAVVVYPRIQFDVRFLSEFLRFMDLGQYSVSAAQPGISVERINMLSIAVPPIEEQSLIGQRISQVELQIERLVVKAEAGVLLLKERRTALISAAVTGKIDLRGWTPPADEVAA